MAAMKYTFKAGFRKVTVQAKSLYLAIAKARVELDKRCIRAGNECPVSWSLRRVK